MRVRPSRRRLGAVVALAAFVALVSACDDPPTTVTAAVTYDCHINPNNFLVPSTTGTMTASYDTLAPQAVAPGGKLTVTITPEPFTIAASTSGGTVTQLSGLVWKVAVPANATLVSHAIAGWANVGPGTPTSSASGGVISVSVPGPIPAGTTATLPTVSMTLEATGAVGSRIEPTIAGSSYASNGLTFNTQVTGTLVGTLNPTLRCFPSPSPALHSTLISNDTKAPVITIASPTANQSITQGATVPADFTCDDGDGVGVQSCVGTVADGAAIDTATLGAHSFTVTATDNEGKVGTKTVTYTVVAP